MQKLQIALNTMQASDCWHGCY